MDLAAIYRESGSSPPRAGCRVADRDEDRIVVFDELGRELVSAVAPPFVSPRVYDRYATVAKRLPDLDLRVEWQIRRWPKHGSVSWAQAFRDGREEDAREPTGAEETPAGPDLVIACDYRDFARFLLGAGPITNSRAPIRIVKGGVAEVSCLGGLILDEASLRHVAMPADVRRLVAEGVAQL
jgi:hypothetical protein